MPKLVIRKGSEIVREHTVSVDIVAFTVGSEPGNDIVIDDPKVSMLHLQFECEGSHYYVRDLRSATGTFVNGERVQQRARVNDGDVIEIGDHRIEFSHPVADREVPPLLPDKWSEAPSENDQSRPEGVDEIVQARQHTVENVATSEADQVTISSPYVRSTDNTDPFELLFGTPGGEDAHPEQQSLEETEETARCYLLAIYGPYLGERYALNLGETRIGRDTGLNDIIVRENEQGEVDTSISRRHATISYRDGDYYLTDKRSKTRTYVNQRKVEPEDEVLLKPGDEIEIVSDQKSTIFRFVREGDWDFRTPRQAGVWWVRHRWAFAGALSAALLIVCIVVIWRAWSYRQIVAVKPDTVELTEMVWYEDPIGLPLDGGAEVGAELAVADVDGDGAADLVLSDPSGTVKAISGRDRSVLWTVTDFEANAAIPITLAELNGDGCQDVIVTSIDSRVRAIDGKWGVEIWTSPILGGLFAAPPVVADFNGDGLLDVVVTTTEGGIHTGLGSLTEPLWRQSTFGVLSHAVPAAEDVSGNGLAELLVGTETGKVIVFSGARNQVLGAIDMNAEIAKTWGVAGASNPIRAPIVSGDFDGDGVTDFVVATDAGNVLAMDGNSLQRLWGERLRPPAQPMWNAYSVRIGDLDGDGRSDALIAVRDGRLRAIKTQPQSNGGGEVLWDYEAAPGTEWVSAPALADFNKNGTADVVLASRRGRVEILEGSTGRTIAEWNANTLPVLAGPVVADVDGDTYLDILIRRGDGRFYQMSSNRRVLHGSVVWGQTAGGPQHTGRLVYAEPSGTTAAWTLVGAMGIAVATILLNVTAYRKRRSLAESR